MSRTSLFSPEKSFIRLPIVWGTVCIILGLSLIIGIIILIHSNLSADFSANGFNYFITAFRVPLGIATLIIPIVALLAANHRSEQTKKQIELTNAQNIFSNHFKHLEEFEKALGHINTSSIKVSQPRKLHSKLYPDTLNNNLGISTKALSILKSTMDNIHFHLEAISSITDKKVIEHMVQIDDLIRELHQYFLISDERKYRSFPNYQPEDGSSSYQLYSTSHESLLGWLGYLKQRITYLTDLVNFMPEPSLQFLDNYREIYPRINVHKNYDIQEIQIKDLKIKVNPYV